MAEKGRDVNAFVSVSNYFGEVMKKKLHIPDNKLHIVPIGVNPDQYEVIVPSLEPPVIGYLSRMCEDNGFEILIDAFIELKDNSVFKNAKLRLNGGMTSDDKQFINKQIKKLKRKGYSKDVDLYKDFNTNHLPVFFRGLSVMSVPVLKGEAFGIYQIESMASGIPVVQPALGAFPEIIQTTGGGTIYHPNTPAALASALTGLFSNPEQLQKMSVDGRNAVMLKYNSQTLTEQMIGVYEKVLQEVMR